MTAQWDSLYVRTDSTTAVAEALIATLTSAGYQRFDPFPGGAGTPIGIKETVKLFVAPPVDGIVRVIGGLPENVTLPLNFLRAWISDDNCGVMAYRDGVADASAIADYLTVGKSLDDLAKAEQRPALGVVNKSASTNLAPELAQFAEARGVNPQQADKLINRLTGQLFGKMDRQSSGEAGALKDQAKALLSQAQADVDWGSPQARKLLTLVESLVLPSNWRDPDFNSLREAYQVARRLARNPKALLLPDEKQALNKVAGAIDYQAIYMGK
ncbi:MAG: hypothetical protein KF726_08505 [Anaerolineae bacterium]|nr:hypothetical protein [Anaerolineae bacterium]